MSLIFSPGPRKVQFDQGPCGSYWAKFYLIHYSFPFLFSPTHLCSFSPTHLLVGKWVEERTDFWCWNVVEANKLEVKELLLYPNTFEVETYNYSLSLVETWIILRSGLLSSSLQVSVGFPVYQSVKCEQGNYMIFALAFGYGDVNIGTEM